MASELFVSRFGRGRPLLCLHGIEAHGLRFIGLASYLDGFEIIAPDLRGHGRSPRNGAFSLDEHVRDILPILRDLGPATTLLGHSYGGYIAWEVASAAPGAIASLILVDPAMELRPDSVRQYIATAPSTYRWRDRRLAYAELSSRRQPSALWSVALDVAVGLEATDGNLHVAMEDEAFGACWDQVTRPIKESTWRGPTLLVEAGLENQEFVTASALASLRHQLGDQLRHEVVDLPHAIPTDGPAVLAEHVRTFLAT